MCKTIAETIINVLEQEGVRHVFGLVGGGSIFLFDALGRSSIKPVFLLHEQSCAIAADSYAQATEKLGVLMVTTGPGVTNTITGVTASYIDSTPLLIISGQTNTFQSMHGTKLRQRGIQEVNTKELVKPIVKDFYSVGEKDNKEDVVYELNKLIEVAKTPRKGPVWLEVPLNIQNR